MVQNLPDEVLYYREHIEIDDTSSRDQTWSAASAPKFPKDFGNIGGERMGGFGSGRPAGYGRETVESCRFLDVNHLHRVGCLTPGWRGEWQWTRDGKRVAWISLRAEEDRLVLSYNYRRNGGEWQDVEQPAPIVRVPCRFGGHRPYFQCPGVVNGVHCGRRVAKLYGADRYFLFWQ